MNADDSSLFGSVKSLPHHLVLREAVNDFMSLHKLKTVVVPNLLRSASSVLSWVRGYI